MLGLLRSYERYQQTVHIWERTLAEESEAARAKSGRFETCTAQKKKKRHYYWFFVIAQLDAQILFNVFIYL